MRRISLIALAVFVFSAASVVFGQSVTSRVSGTVRDSQGAIVAGAAVTLIDTKTKDEKTTTTNDEGAFNLVDVRPGDYVLAVEQKNFKKKQVTGIEVHIDTPVVLNVSLEPGELAETVTVTASETQTLIRTEDAKLSTTVDVRQVQDLPLNGRNPINIAGGMAGVNTNTNVRQSVINGLRGSFSNITWDGIEINDNLVRTDALFGVNTPSVAGVAEFTVTTQNAGPDEGLGIAQVKFTTPRGGSSYHGEVYDFYRNDKFDANTFFNNAAGRKADGTLVLPKPKLLQHQYGFNVGGPFALPRFGEGGPSLTEKNKLFFYFFYEFTDTKQDFTPLRTVLSAGARTGNFTYLATCGASGQPACPAGIVTGQPLTINVLTKTGRTIDARSQALIDLTPAGNSVDAGDGRNTTGYRFNTPNGSTGRNIGFRLDYDINSKNRVEGVYSHFLSKLPNDVQLNNIGEQFPGLPGGGQESSRPRYALAWISTILPSLTNELRFGFSSSTPQFVNRETFDVGYRLVFDLGITNPIQNFLKQGRAPRNHDLLDNATWVKGDHVIKFGASYRHINILNFNDAGIVPQFTLGFNSTTSPLPGTFANNTTNFPGGISSSEHTNAQNLLAFLSGQLRAGTQTFNIDSTKSGFVPKVGSNRNLVYTTLAFYGGDTWRARKNLSLNFGLRWEYISPLTERDGLGLMPADTSLAVLSNPTAQLVFAGRGTGREFTAKDLNNFAPNFSFAWDPFSDGKTSIRGGFSIAYAIDNNATVFNNSSVNGNAGLQSTITRDFGGTVSAGIPTIAPPPFQVPRTLEQNLQLSQAPTLFTTEFKLKTPYAEQWNFGIEREIWRDTGLSVGYVGNRGVQLTRGIDTNQVVIFQNGFFADFLRGQGNLTAVRAERDRINADATLTAAQRTALLNARPVSAAFNNLVPGSVALSIFPRLGNGGGNLANGTIVTLFDEGRVGELVSNYLNARCTYFIQNPVQGCQANFGVAPNGLTAANGLGTEFFLPTNRNAFVTDYIGSSGWSNYHGLQAEVRKRLSNGYYYQINYTWSKAFTNAEQAQTEFAPYLDNTLGDALEKKRNAQDVQHVIKGNFVYELPFGPGKRFWNGGGVAGKLLGGWQVSGLGQWRTGRPITFSSGRGTVNRNGRSGNNTANTTLTIPELQDRTGLYYNPCNGLPLLLDPTLINIGTCGATGPTGNGRANPAFFTHPAAGTFGRLSLTPVDGPGYWNVDAALIKRTRFKERVGMELRLEAFNVFNHTNFSVGNDQDINSTNFGKITSAFDPRIFQLAWKFTF